LFSERSGIAFIGAGKVAFSLAPALVKAGYRIDAVISRKRKSAAALAEKSDIPLYSDNPGSLSYKTKIFFITVPDNQIKIISENLSGLNLDFENSLFIHVSGALNISELRSLKGKGGSTASFHIMQTFPSRKTVEIKNHTAAIEAETKAAKNLLNKMSLRLKLKPFTIKSSDKIYYHLAGVFISNFLVGNVFSSEKLLRFFNDRRDFFKIFNSILNSTLDNVRKTGACKALTGPVERGDYKTIERHLSSLKKKDKLLYLSYIIQSLNLLEVVKAKNKKPDKGQRRIKKLLMDQRIIKK